MGWWQNSATRNLALSEPLADLTHKIPYWATGNLESVRYVSPIFGAITIAAYLVLAHRLARVFDLPLWALRAFVIASPLPFWYITGYIENTFLALPFMLLGIERTLAYFASSRRRTLCAAATAFALAGLFHAGFALMCVAFAGALLLDDASPFRRRVADVLCSAGIVLTVVGLLLGLLQLLPVDLVRGNTSGGYDHDLLTPMVSRAGNPMFRFVFLSHAHVIEVANIVVHASLGLVLALPLLAALGLRRRRLAHVLIAGQSPATAALTMLACTACTAFVYIVFVSIWGFDYGSVGDLDLMLVMGAGLGLYVLTMSGSLLRHRPAVLAALLTTSSVADVAFYSMKVANAWV